MALLLNKDTPDYLKAAWPGITYPITMACLFQATDLTSPHTLMDVTDESTAHNFFILRAAGNESGNPVAFYCNDGVPQTVLTTSAYTINTWHHACGIQVLATERYVFIDGGNKGMGIAGNVQPTGLDRVDIGFSGDSTPGFGLDGMIAEPVIWNVALTDAEVAMLPFVSPLLVRPQNIIMYKRLIRLENIDLVGGLSFTEVGSPTIAPHPRVFYIAPPSISHLAPAAGAQTVTLSALTLAGSVPSAAVQAQGTVTLDALTLGSSVPSLTVTPGEIIITLDALTLGSSVPSASVTPGAVTVTLDALTLASSIPALTVTPGGVTVTLDALTLASSVPSASVTPGSIIITLDALILASTLIDITARGAALSKLKGGWPFWRF